jgi:hypothetical protein
MPMSVRFEDEQLHQIKTIVERDGITFSEFLRRAVDRALHPDPPMSRQDADPMLGVFAFGDFDHPRYRATNNRGGGDASVWCCPMNGGHWTPDAAAEHLAMRMAAAWHPGPGGERGKGE